jgi:hypothetical protein
MDDLISVISAIIRRQQKCKEPEIIPSAVAAQALRELDPERISVPSVYAGCEMMGRRIARDCLSKIQNDGDRKEFDPDNPQQELFDDLREYYPRKKEKKTEPKWRRLELMSDEDIEFNIARFRAYARADNRHADALQSYLNERRGRHSA